MPRISVLMPTHNRADVLGYAIDSVLRQTEPDFELLVVGDGCTDNTARIVKSFQDSRIVWYDLPKAPNFGYANRNIALRKARGELIAFAAHDDLMFPDHLALLSHEIDAGKLDWIYSRPLWVSTDGVIVPFCTNLHNADELDLFMNIRNSIPAGCVMHRRSCFDKSGYWPEDVESAGDWLLWQRIIKAGNCNKFGYCRTPTTLHFSADWKNSRHSGSIEVMRMLEVADHEPWWPAPLRYPVAKQQLEQDVLQQAMKSAPTQWCRNVRDGVSAVVDRLAWDKILQNPPPRIIEKTIQERHDSTAQLPGAMQKLKRIFRHLK